MTELEQFSLEKRREGWGIYHFEDMPVEGSKGRESICSVVLSDKTRANGQKNTGNSVQEIFCTARVLGQWNRLHKDEESPSLELFKSELAVVLL